MEISLSLTRERHYDEQVLDVLARLYGREKSPEVLLDVIGELIGKDRERVESAKSLVREGISLSQALYDEGLISQPTYLFLLSAERSRNLKEFVWTYRKVNKSLSEVLRKFIGIMISPLLAMVGSLLMTYMFLYRVLPGMDLPREKAMAYLPFYFPLVFTLSSNPLYFLMFAVFLGFLVVFIYTKRKDLPYLRNVFRFYDRIKFYAFLWLAVKAGYKLEKALEKYQGELKDVVERVLERSLAEGISPRAALLEELSIEDVVEKSMVKSALLAEREDLVNSLEELFKDSFETLLWRLSIAGNIVNLVSLITVGFIVIVNYVGIFLPAINAMRRVVAS